MVESTVDEIDNDLETNPLAGEVSTSTDESRSAAVDSAMLDLLPALELRSTSGEALAAGDDQDHSANVDETLRLLAD